MCRLLRPIRRGVRGTVLVFTLLIMVVLFILACAYLGTIERDYRFAGYQERSERAWQLAMSGLEYYRIYGCGNKKLSSPGQVLSTPKVLLRVYVPKDCTDQYFELTDVGCGNLLSRGVVVGSLASIKKQKVAVSRSAIAPAQQVGCAYDAAVSL